LFYLHYLFSAGTYTVTVGSGGALSGADGGSSSIRQSGGKVIFQASGGGGGATNSTSVGDIGGSSGGGSPFYIATGPMRPVGSNNVVAGSAGISSNSSMYIARSFGGVGQTGCSSTSASASCNGGGGGGGGGNGQAGNLNASGSGGIGIYSMLSIDFADHFGPAYTQVAFSDELHDYIAGGGGGGGGRGDLLGGLVPGGMGGGGYGSEVGMNGSGSPRKGMDAWGNTGSGGGGGSCNFADGGAGADGLVILLYSECVSCLAGQFSSSSNNRCSLCDVGKYTSQSDSVNCSTCDIGAYTSSPGSSQCEFCVPGSFMSATGSSTCTLCGAGTYFDASKLNASVFELPSPQPGGCSACMPNASFAKTGRRVLYTAR
jgi:hypothetical protein